MNQFSWCATSSLDWNKTPLWMSVRLRTGLEEEWGPVVLFSGVGSEHIVHRHGCAVMSSLSPTARKHWSHHAHTDSNLSHCCEAWTGCPCNVCTVYFLKIPLYPLSYWDLDVKEWAISLESWVKFTHRMCVSVSAALLSQCVSHSARPGAQLSQKNQPAMSSHFWLAFLQRWRQQILKKTSSN